MSEPATLSATQREKGSIFAPKFDSNGLLTAVVVSASTREVLVVAYMNDAALQLTRDTGKVHFWSRSRQSLWLKGETSGNELIVAEMLVDCDQDALVIRANPVGPTCHTGETSCFYRKVVPEAENAIALVKVKT